MNNILIIGNGFDIYHGLPTRYNDFLFMAEHWDEFYKLFKTTPSVDSIDEFMNIRLDKGKLCSDSIEDYVRYKHLFDCSHIEYMNEHIIKNAWIRHFLEIKFNGRGWVDFETEVEHVLQAVDLFFNELPNHANGSISGSQVATSDIRSIAKRFLSLTKNAFDCDYFGYLHISVVEAPRLREHRLYLIEKLKDELDELNECLRLYLLEFVTPIRCACHSEQVKELGGVQLLNFNYTYTYKQVYGNMRSEHHPIHGDCLNGGMVLGISDDSFNEKLEYIYFVKYFQRIQKRTGSFYKDWIKQPAFTERTTSDVPRKIYIIGHSLAETDKGVLTDFFQSDWVESITIFYHDQSSYEEMVINLVAMFGKEFVIAETGSGRILFEKLQEAIPGSAIDSMR